MTTLKKIRSDTAKRQRELVDRRRRDGLVRLTVWVPATRAEQLRAIAKDMRENAAMGR